jgi:VRR-NUC domain
MPRNAPSKMPVAGKRKHRIEEQHQVAFVAWFRTQYPQYAKLLTLGSFGENIGERRMVRLKQMGLTPGYPDILICLPKQKTAALWIEMKTKKGKVSSNQAEVHKLLISHSYSVNVAHDWEEAKDIVQSYITNF